MGWEPCLGWGRLWSCAPSPLGTLSRWIESDQKGHMGASADHLGFNTSPEIVLTTLKAHQSVPKNILGSQSSAVPRQLFTFASSLIPSCPPRGRNTQAFPEDGLGVLVTQAQSWGPILGCTHIP